MSDPGLATATLEDRARSFAAELTTTLRAVLGPGVPEFVAEAGPLLTPEGLTRLSIHTVENAEIPLTVNQEDALYLVVDYTCQWDHGGAYLAVRKASVQVFSFESTDPLFRYEFVDAMSPNLPSAHLHVHAHRDEILYQLFRSTKGKGKSRGKAVEDPDRSSPRLSNLHFPLGGARMRPVLEDVLQMLITEFCIDTVHDPLPALRAGRARWRRHQIGTLVRDSPAEAVRVLRHLGYDVAWASDDPEPGERIDRLTSL